MEAYYDIHLAKYGLQKLEENKLLLKPAWNSGIKIGLGFVLIINYLIIRFISKGNLTFHTSVLLMKGLCLRITNDAKTK